MNHQYGLDDLRHRRLKVATIADLNDPFELIGPSTKDPALRAAFRRVKEQLSVNRGMLCFSRSWRNPVQWSHYADRHRGLCLGFDIVDKHLTPVQYIRKRLEPEAETLASRTPAALAAMLRILTSKYSHWRYENEERTFVTLDEVDKETGLYFVDFSDSMKLAEVIVGHSSALSYDEIVGALGDLAPDVKVLRPNFHSVRSVSYGSANARCGSNRSFVFARDGSLSHR